MITGDAHIDATRESIEERCFTLLARQQPVATDLRTITTAMRIVGDLERMGDLAAHVAKLARMRSPDHAMPVPTMVHDATPDGTEPVTSTWQRTGPVAVIDRPCLLGGPAGTGPAYRHVRP